MDSVTPFEFVNTARKACPYANGSSRRDVVTPSSVGSVAPAMSVHGPVLFLDHCHCTVGSGVPVASA